MSAYLGEYIKSCKWSINPKYVNLAIILHIFSSMKSHVPYWWNCKFSSFFWYLSLGYLLPSSMHSNYLFSLSDSCDVFDVFVFEVHSMYNKIKLSLWPCYQAKIFLLYCMTLLWISCSFFNIYFVCTCFFEDKYLRDAVHLETYTNERWYLPIWYPIYILCVGSSC